MERVYVVLEEWSVCGLRVECSCSGMFVERLTGKRRGNEKREVFDMKSLVPW
jgi:hypothetical protein